MTIISLSYHEKEVNNHAYFKQGETVVNFSHVRAQLKSPLRIWVIEKNLHLLL